MIQTPPDVPRALPYLAMCVVILCNVSGNIFIKYGSIVRPDRAVILGLFGWQTAAGIGFFATGVIFYAWALKHLPLYVAQSMTALQFTGAVLAAALVFGEPITVQKWLGMGLIAAGISIVAW